MTHPNYRNNSQEDQGRCADTVTGEYLRGLLRSEPTRDPSAPTDQNSERDLYGRTSEVDNVHPLMRAKARSP